MEDLIKAFMQIAPAISGDGYGYGYGYGDGYGSGSGDGDGSGDGYGSGYGYGDIKPPVFTEYKKGFLTKEIHGFKTFNKQPVYYIDNIPCIFLSIVNNVAKVNVINDDMSVKTMYIAKSGNLFAHGDNKEHAVRSVTDKFFASLSFEQKKTEFVSKFKKEIEYSNRLFFAWHHHLTGSCESGRMLFVKSHGIDLDGKMTTLNFLNLTKNEYNGSAITEILNSI